MAGRNTTVAQRHLTAFALPCHRFRTLTHESKRRIANAEGGTSGQRSSDTLRDAASAGQWIMRLSGLTSFRAGPSVGQSSSWITATSGNFTPLAPAGSRLINRETNDRARVPFSILLGQSDRTLLGIGNSVLRCQKYSDLRWLARRTNNPLADARRIPVRPDNLLVIAALFRMLENAHDQIATGSLPDSLQAGPREWSRLVSGKLVACQCCYKYPSTPRAASRSRCTMG